MGGESRAKQAIMAGSDAARPNAGGFWDSDRPCLYANHASKKHGLGRPFGSRRAMRRHASLKLRPSPATYDSREPLSGCGNCLTAPAAAAVPGLVSRACRSVAHSQLRVSTAISWASDLHPLRRRIGASF